MLQLILGQLQHVTNTIYFTVNNRIITIICCYFYLKTSLNIITVLFIYQL